MSEEDKQGKKPIEETNGKDKTKEQTQGLEVNVQVSGKEEIDELKKKLEKALEDKKSSEATLTDLTKKVSTLTEQKQISEEEKDDLKAKLETIAEKAFKKAKDDFIGQAKDYMTEEQVKDIESEIDTPEKLENSRFLLGKMKEMKETWKKQEEELKKQAGLKDQEKKIKEQEKGTPTGGGAAGKAQLTNTPDEDLGGVKEYDTYKAMIDDLRVREKSKDPKVSEEAHTILNSLFQKWVVEIRKDHAKSRFGSIGEDEKKSLTQVVKEGVVLDKGKTEEK